jgi:hypothetical protein
MAGCRGLTAAEFAAVAEGGVGGGGADVCMLGGTGVTSQILKQRENEFPYFQNLEPTKTLMELEVVHSTHAYML